MKAVILCGGLGTRISEESHLRPKPMVEIGGRPILWHIMKIYGHYNITDFIVCCGYKGYVIKEYFANYFLHMSDVTFDISRNKMEVHHVNAEPWRVTLVDTGEHTMTGGRLKRVSEYLDGTFCLTYGDGVSDVNISSLIQFHQMVGAQATITAVQPEGRFGSLTIDNNHISSFEEKPRGDGRWINGGFFVCEPSVLDRIDGDDTLWEADPLNSLTRDRQLSVFKHYGFWSAMDTIRDKQRLDNQWISGKAPWKVWD